MKRPWNLPDHPVYSLATYKQGKANMNICTYVSAVSLQPKFYAIAIHNGTKTLNNIKQCNTAILQYLHPSQFKLVRTLGKKSGKAFDKHSYLEKKNLLTTWQGFQVLQNASAFVLLRKISFQTTGDHTLYIFEALKYRSIKPEILTTRILRMHKIISV